jgi:hypothetical protein
VSLFEQLGKIAARAVTLPVSVVKDVTTLGGALTDGNLSTADHLRKLIEDIDELPESMEDDDD